MKNISIIIINFNTFQLTSNCIKSIYEHYKKNDFEIILVDNASTECDASLFLVKFPNIKLIKSEQNVGFAKGNNLGINAANGDYILLLNSDTEFKNDAITPCVQYLINHENVGVVTTKLIFPDGKVQSTCQRFPNVFYNLLELIRFQKIFPEFGGRLLLGGFFDYNSKAKVDWTWGAFFMFPIQILKELPDQKLYDKFFMYCEDIKWCLDVRNIGKEIHYIPNGEVIHYMGASSGAKKPLMIKNHEILMNENFSFIHRFFIKISDKIVELFTRN